MIHYLISLKSRQQHTWIIQLSLHHEKLAAATVYLPNWTPGSYMIRDFSRNIVFISATQKNTPLKLTQLNKNSWRTAPFIGTCIIEYHLYAFDLSIRASYLDCNRGFLNGAAGLIGIKGFENSPHTVEFTELPEKWQIACNLPQNHHEYFTATSYQQLIDHPFELGHFTIIEFSCLNIPHRIVISGHYFAFDKERLKKDIQKICKQQIQFFDNAPFNNYLFILHVHENSYGGLEHLNSSALLISKKCLPLHKQPINQDYISLLGLFSHEYFHAWNIKSIKPALFEHYNLEQEVYSEQLWFFEGATAFYDDLFLLKAATISPTQYLDLVAANINSVYQERGHLTQSIAESSFNAWTKFYKQDENNINTIVSYYKKGGLVAFCLDIYLRQQSNGQHSLNSVLRTLFNHSKIIEEKQWEQKVAQMTGVDLTEFFDQFVYGTKLLELPQYFALIGINFAWLASTETTAVVDTFPAEDAALDFGAKMNYQATGLLVKQVLNNSNAEQAGLNPNDVIVAINRFHAADFDYIWKQLKAGDKVTLHFLRDNYLFETEWIASAQQQYRAYFKINDLALFQNWYKN